MFKNGVAAFDGVAGAMVESFPGRRSKRNIADETAGTIRKVLGDIDDLAVRSVRGLERAFGRRTRDFFKRDEGGGGVRLGNEK